MEKEKKKKVRVRKMKGIKRVSMKERIGNLFFTVVALIIAIVVFAGFMLLQSVFSENIIYREVLVVVKEIPEGEILTEENVGDYLGAKKMNELDTTVGAVSPGQIRQLVGMRARVPLHVGEEVTATDFSDVNVYLDYIENPVEMSIAASGIDGTDGGKIRGGDIVNITMMFTKEQLGIGEGAYLPSSAVYTGEKDGEEGGDGKGGIGNLTRVDGEGGGYNFGYYAKYMLENIYIKEALTADGQSIAPTDKDTVVGVLVVVVPKRIELQLNNIISNCSSMRISKVLYEISPDDLFKDSSLKNSISVLEELPVEGGSQEGWTAPDGLGYRYKPHGDGTHTRWIDAGIEIDEPCDFGDSGYCIHCNGQREGEADGEKESGEKPDMS